MEGVQESSLAHVKGEGGVDELPGTPFSEVVTGVFVRKGLWTD